MTGRQAAAVVVVAVPVLALALMLAGVNAVLTEIERVEGW